MLYLHIPFCKQACSYCNFHFSTSQKGRTELLRAMQHEIDLRAASFNHQAPETIYFGGGTPSLLSGQELNDIFQSIARAYAQGGFLISDFNVANSSQVQQGAKPGSTLPPPKSQDSQSIDRTQNLEITLEANPDDLTAEKVAILAASPVNRLSIGLQSFNAEDLKFMNRAHTAAESAQSMERVLKAGFSNISVDLIYGSPTTTDAIWDDNISRVLDFGVPHVSAYALTVEPKTALAHRVETGKTPAPSEARFARQYDRLIERLTLAGYEHYEISNFALPGHYSRHNTAYWQGKPYVGIGPAAHGFNGIDERRWNIANNAIYTKNMLKIEHPEGLNVKTGLYVSETLSLSDRYNEFIMTGLRTQWGVSLQMLNKKFGASFSQYFQNNLAEHLKVGYFEVSALKNGIYQLTPAGRHYADGIAAAAFFVVE